VPEVVVKVCVFVVVNVFVALVELLDEDDELVDDDDEIDVVVFVVVLPRNVLEENVLEDVNVLTVVVVVAQSCIPSSKTH